MQVVFSEIQFWEDNPVAHLTCEDSWMAAFIKTKGGTISREKVRHSEVVHRSVETYRGRQDVRRVRAQSTRRPAPGRVRNRTREYRPGATRRTSSSSRTSSADPGDSDSDESEPSEGELCCCGCHPAKPIRWCACGCGREITHRRGDGRRSARRAGSD